MGSIFKSINKITIKLSKQILRRTFIFVTTSVLKIPELLLQGTMPSSIKRPSRLPMWKGVKFAYLIIAMCLFPLAIGGYWAYGNMVRTCANSKLYQTCCLQRVDLYLFWLER